VLYNVQFNIVKVHNLLSCYICIYLIEISIESSNIIIPNKLIKKITKCENFEKKLRGLRLTGLMIFFKIKEQYLPIIKIYFTFSWLV
jgi:hypothetical protein